MTTQPTTTTKILLSDLPYHLLGEITQHLDPITRIKLLPESFHQEGDARAANAANAALYKSLHEEKVLSEQRAAALKEEYDLVSGRAIARGETIQQQREFINTLRIENLDVRMTCLGVQIELHRAQQDLQAKAPYRHKTEDENDLERAIERAIADGWHPSTARRLLTKGFARRLKREWEEGGRQGDKPAEAMTVKELRAECKERGIKGYSKLAKARLVSMCQAARESDFS